jgi:xanthine dehydrogenase accessory factor
MNDRTAWHQGDARDIYAELAAMTERGEEGVLVTVIRTARSVPRHAGSKMIVRPDGRVTGSVGGGRVEVRAVEEAVRVLADGQCRRLICDLGGADGVCGGEVELFLEPVLASTPCWIVGAGHVGRALARAAADLSLSLRLVDDRQDFLEGFDTSVRTLAAAPDAFAESFRATPRTAVVIASRDHELDGDYLEAVFGQEILARTRCAYIGVVGSRHKAAHLARRFAARPELAQRFAEVQIPVGLDIGAETPAEIAISILADLLGHLRPVQGIRDQDGALVGLQRLASRPRS